jgi:hypothetical protein
VGYRPSRSLAVLGFAGAVIAVALGVVYFAGDLLFVVRAG